MIALLLALQAAVPAPTGLGPIGVQAMPVRGCAAFLWTIGDPRTLVAMAGADAAQLHIALDGKTIDLARITDSGPSGFGFAATTAYRAADTTATLDIEIATRADLTAGASIPRATLRIERPGRDTVVTPLVGLIGCTT